MGKAPQSPRPATRRRRRKPRTKTAATSSAGTKSAPAKSSGGTSTGTKVLGLAAGALALGGTLTGLNGSLPFQAPAPITCNGSERWPVKVAVDPDARANQIDLNPQGPYTVSQINQMMRPTLFPTNGRMDLEKKVYTVRGFISFYKQETGADGDRDYHVVITDHPGQYTENKDAAPDGQSMVVEFPDVRCLGGKSGLPVTPDSLTPAVADARATFEKHAKWPKNRRLTQAIPVTVTGIGFFDFEHKQKGRAKDYPDPHNADKVFELHPVTEIVFQDDID